MCGGGGGYGCKTHEKMKSEKSDLVSHSKDEK